MATRKKTNKKQVVDYRFLQAYLKQMRQEGIKVNVKLNKTKAVLWEEFKRLTGYQDHKENEARRRREEQQRYYEDTQRFYEAMKNSNSYKTQPLVTWYTAYNTAKPRGYYENEAKVMADYIHSNSSNPDKKWWRMVNSLGLA